MANPLLVLRTLRYLRWQQLAYRPWRRVQRRLPHRSLSAGWSLSPSLPALAEALLTREPADPAQTLHCAEQVRRGEFCFLGKCLQADTVDWRRRYHNHLWTYHLHYFDYAPELARAFRYTADAEYLRTFERLALSWIDQTSPAAGDAWAPYPLATRVPNWLAAILLFGEDLPQSSRARLLDSAHRQLLHLERTLEYHLLANHLQRNLYALAVGGLCFDSAAAARWRGGRTTELWRELEEQVLPDGGHYERSPMYHALALADFLTVIELRRAAGAPVPEAVLARVAAAARALTMLSRPDGSLHLFNDSAHGTAPATDWLLARAESLAGAQLRTTDGAWALPDTGYYGWADAAAGEGFIVDCGELGPSYNAAHGHCDMLSFELDLFGRPVCVDAGVRGYDGDPLRAYVRSTAAHNTVVIDGREQSELWGTFRAARRARPERVRQRADEHGYHFAGAYRPFFDHGVRHARTVTRSQQRWTVTDTVQGARSRPLRSYLHFHPDCIVTRIGSGCVVRVAGRELRVETFGADDVAVDTTSHRHCPAFGTALPAPTLTLTVRANDEREFGYRLQTGDAHV